MHPDSVEKTAFITPDGLYEWLRMPFGLCNAPSVYQAMMDEAFRDMLASCLKIYVDDLLVHSDGASDEEAVNAHIQHLEMPATEVGCAKWVRGDSWKTHFAAHHSLQTLPNLLLQVYELFSLAQRDDAVVRKVLTALPEISLGDVIAALSTDYEPSAIRWRHARTPANSQAQIAPSYKVMTEVSDDLNCY